MPSASLASQSNLTEGMSHLTASQIAAQAAFQHRVDTQLQNQSDPQHNRKRSETVPQQAGQQDVRRSSKTYSPPIPQTQNIQHTGLAVTEQQYKNGLIGNAAATTAAAAAFPRLVHVPTEEKESKKGLKRFRPKNIGISRDKDKEIEKPMPSPNKIQHSGLSQVTNASTTSLADTISSSNSSMYLLNTNASTATVVNVGDKPEKEKSHKHTLRQKLKLKDKDDYKSLALSSASSNSRPADLNNPQSLYTFAPSSPGPASSFSKTVSGLDLRHGGRALREKKKEEKAQAAGLEPSISRGESETSEWPGLGSSLQLSTTSFMPYANESLAGFGLNNMTADDAWDFLKAKILVIFEGEDVRIPVEDLNKLVTIHIQQCVHKRDPSIIVGDLEDLLKTGFLSLNHTIRSVPDDRLIPHLVGMWMRVFGAILPFMQAVFLPLDLEFKGRGSILTTPKLASEFWGNLPSADTGSVFSSSVSLGGDFDTVVSAGEELEVRRIVLIAFRDTVITPRFEMLKSTFSRLSLESINVSLSNMEGGRTRGNSGGSAGDRPGTATSLDPNNASYSSQSSTLLGSAAASSGARSRATSNLSNGSNPAQEVAFQSFSSPPATRPQDLDSKQVTETVGRMLQCLCVLCSVQSGDASQEKLEELSRQLKLNWLGRGRTGRNRKGFVGSRVRPMRSMGSTIRQAVQGSREGSPTPTPTRQGTVTRTVEMVGVAA
jgi:HbrB-like